MRRRVGPDHRPGAPPLLDSATQYRRERSLPPERHARIRVKAVVQVAQSTRRARLDAECVEHRSLSRKRNRQNADPGAVVAIHDIASLSGKISGTTPARGRPRAAAPSALPSPAAPAAQTIDLRVKRRPLQSVQLIKCARLRRIAAAERSLSGRWPGAGDGSRHGSRYAHRLETLRQRETEMA